MTPLPPEPAWPELPAALHPFVLRHRYIPPSLACHVPNMARPRRSLAQQMRRANPDALRDRILWSIGVVTTSRARMIVAEFWGDGAIDREFADELLELIQERTLAEGKA